MWAFVLALSVAVVGLLGNLMQATQNWTQRDDRLIALELGRVAMQKEIDFVACAVMPKSCTDGRLMNR
jgi:hypothetical protein